MVVVMQMEIPLEVGDTERTGGEGCGWMDSTIPTTIQPTPSFFFFFFFFLVSFLFPVPLCVRVFRYILVKRCVRMREVLSRVV